MKPKKSKLLIADITEGVGIPEKDLEKIVDFYYSKVRESLSNLEHLRVHVTNLGDFVFKQWKLKDLIASNEELQHHENERVAGRASLKLERLKKLQVLFNEEQERKHKIKTNESNQNLEE